MNYIIFILIKVFTEPSCPIDGARVILEETTAIRIEMLSVELR